MDGIAIIYERIEIGENQFAFKPIFVEEGTLDDDKLLFLSHNTVYPHVYLRIYTLMSSEYS